MSSNDLFGVLAIATTVCLTVGLIGIGALRLLRTSSITVQTTVVALGAVVATLTGITSVAAAMFVSPHDFLVALYVCAISGMAAVLLSLTLSKRLMHTSRSVAKSRERERAMENSRRELIAWISHDLRAPLVGLRSTAEALEEGLVDDPESAHKQLRCEVDRITSMVDDVVELSHAQSGPPRLAQHRVKLSKLLTGAIASTQSMASARDIHIDNRSTCAVEVYADSQLLIRALSTVLIHAIRHAPAESTIDVTAHSNNGQSANVWVTDSCGGLAEHDLKRVFDTAWSGNSATETATHNGTSVRLAAVKSIIEAHGGSTSIVNAGDGCRCEITLPTAAGE